MTTAKEIGASGRIASYEVPDSQLAVGSTLGGPKTTAIIKASGAIEKVFSVDAGRVLFGTLILRHYDAGTGRYLSQDQPGTFIIHPEHQEHIYSVSGDVAVREDIFVLNSGPHENGTVDPPGVYQTLELRNNGEDPIDVATYAFAELRGETEHDVRATFDKRLVAMIAWNGEKREQYRIVGCARAPDGYE